ncbi:hypothetical protein ACSLBF_17040 [Pseudoalteromonas sp. T1lg65]|uniref:arsenate reductase/protein-tyrosine-phosphatase family protein n=1 Tax=Pseudoalteromonas sp. T1lg65 TaxID=2077101 RepID=UPI003F78B1A0
MTHVLFICSRNQWRSPTAERVWRNHPGIEVRSAGTSAKAKRAVSKKDIVWADKILVSVKLICLLRAVAIVWFPQSFECRIKA